MLKPYLWDETTEIEMPMPTSWEISEVIGENKEISLSGKSLNDTNYFKYKYTMNFETSFIDDHTAIANLVRGARGTTKKLWFKWEKFPEAQAYIWVNVSLSPKKFKAGSGSTGYLVSFSLEIEEVNAR